MLLEQLVERAAQPPQYDWDSYYCWYCSTIAGCMMVNLLLLPVKYGKCRGCQMLYLP